MNAEQGGRTTRFLGSLRDALAAASREEMTKTAAEPATVRIATQAITAPASATAAVLIPAAPGTGEHGESPNAAEAARTARGGTPNVPPIDRHIEFEVPPTTRVVRRSPAPAGGQNRTQLIRGKQTIRRGEFQSDPVVAWLVIVGGPGLGAYRPVFEGNNAVGRSSTQRIPIDFGDDAISAEEQAYIRYDSSERAFLFVPNLAKPNVVSINSKRPTGAVPLAAMDVITMGRTQLAFVPFCGAEFDWSELADVNA
jgi:hypothetical protein